jgi:hypothetical protein
MPDNIKFNLKQSPLTYVGEFDQAIRGALTDVYSADQVSTDKFIANFNNRYNTHCDQSDAARASRANSGRPPGMPPLKNGRCIVATELAKQRLWTKTEYADLERWGTEVLDDTWYGRAFHRGYPVVAQHTFVPAVKKSSSLRARYFKWTFENAISLMRGKSFSILSVPGSVFWISVMFIVGVFIRQNRHEQTN